MHSVPLCVFSTDVLGPAAVAALSSSWQLLLSPVIPSVWDDDPRLPLVAPKQKAFSPTGGNPKGQLLEIKECVGRKGKLLDHFTNVCL